MIQTNISLHLEQWKQIKEECERSGQSLSFFLRELVDDYFGKNPEVKSSISVKPKIVKTVTEVKQVIPKITYSPQVDICSHNMIRSLCKRCAGRKHGQ